MVEQTIIILAGGRSSRMGMLTDKTQKCVLIADKKPILGHILDAVYRAFDSPRIIIATGWQSETVYEYLDQYNPKKGKIYFVSDSRCIGTRQAVLQAEHLCKTSFLLLPGNTIVPASALQAFADSFHAHNDPASIAHLLLAKRYHLRPTDSAVRVRDKKVIEIISPPPVKRLRNTFMNTGIMYCPERFFYFLRCAPARMTTISDAIAFGLSHKQTFSFAKHKGRWRHFTTPNNLKTKIRL